MTTFNHSGSLFCLRRTSKTSPYYLDKGRGGKEEDVDEFHQPGHVIGIIWNISEMSGNERTNCSATSPLARWYLDVRPLTYSSTAAAERLPFIETLHPGDQETVKRFYHLKDKHMSLASYLLKYLFIHRACRIPWAEIRLSRTPAPHGRPCFAPPWDDGLKVEFNVSHQASLVALAGTVFYSMPTSPLPRRQQPQVGIDITCVDEATSRGRKEITTAAALAYYVDIFAEVFSPRELATIKRVASSHQQQQRGVESALRLFYTYWALKEAYIKLTGEALLAPWLRELEFTDVQVPEKAAGHDGLLGRPYTGTQTWLYGKKVQGLRIEVQGFEDDYLIATAARGAGMGIDNNDEGLDLWKDLEAVDIERDIALCATGRCCCLSEESIERRLSTTAI